MSLVHVDSTSHTFEVVPSAFDLADRISRTDFVPDTLKGRPDAIAACVLKGHELGFSPMQSLGAIYIVKGRPSLSAEGMRALVLAAGHDIAVKDMTPVKCRLAGRRKGSDEWTEVTFTMDDAKRAKLGGNNWQAYPAEMLLARATSRLCRAVFADVIGGLAATEEVEDYDTDEPTTVKRKAPAKRAAAKAVAEPVAEVSADLPPLPHELDDDIIDAEIVYAPGEEPFTDEPSTDLISDKQMRMVLALFSKAGITDRDDRLAYASEVAGRPLASSKELTKSEASALIDDLQQLEEAHDDVRIAEAEARLL